MNTSISGEVTQDSAAMDRREITSWVLLGVLSTILVYAHWNSLVMVAATWDSAQYSHGYLVPLFAAVLLWLRREPFGEVPTSHRWIGLGILAFAIIMRVESTRNVIFTLDNAAFIPALMGAFVMVGGLKTLRWAGPPIAFLCFMLPLPRLAVDNLLRPLQLIATHSSVFALQTLGVEAYREGNVILLENQAMNVVDQCSGLRMVTIFLALSAALAMIVTTRPWWERLTILASAVPIALAVNVIRITITGLLYNLNVNSEIAQKVFHDWAGFIMMPLALGFLFLELQLLSKLMIELPSDRMNRVGFSQTTRPDSSKAG